jgi:photosystem II stability/assembly factor-like uncharacterized protein
MRLKYIGMCVFLCLACIGFNFCSADLDRPAQKAEKVVSPQEPSEDLPGRAESWQNQRTAPGKALPADARRDALKHKRSMEAFVQEKIAALKKEFSEDLEQRARFWLEQRAYPAKTIPKGARFAALRAKLKMKAFLERPVGQVEHHSPPVAGACNWVQTGPRNINGRIRSLAVDPKNGAIIYAGAAEGGVWRSSNSGLSWYPLMQYQDSIAVGALAIDPINSKIIYAGTGEPTWWPGYEGVGVLKSTNSGATWSATGPMNNGHIARLVIDPTNPQILYCAGFGDAALGGLYKTTNGGTTWKLIHSGDSTDVVLDPKKPLILYEGRRNDGVYKTINGGASWTKLAGGLPAMASQRVMLSLCAASPQTVYAKLDDTVYKTTNGGTTWTNLGSHGGSTYGYWCNYDAVDPTDPKIVFAAGVSLQKSTDGGTTWASSAGSGDAEKTALHADQHALVFEPANHLKLYASNDGGVYHSNDGGATWKKISNGLIVTQFYDVGLSPLVWTVHGGGVQDQGTLATTGGLTWNKLFGADGGFLVFHTKDPYKMIGEWQGNNVIRTMDGGATWSVATTGLTGSGPWVGAIAADEKNPDTVFTGRQQVFRSTNWAVNWTASSPAVGGTVSAIAIAPSNSNIIYAGTSTGRIWKSTNGGTTLAGWTNITHAPLPNRYLTDIAVDWKNPKIVVVSFSGFESATPTAPGHVFRTADGGATWTDISGASALPTSLPNIPANAVALDAQNAATIYVGTDIGMFITTAGGGTWKVFEQGLPHVAVTDLALNQKYNILFAATHGRGMWEIKTAKSCPKSDIYVRDNLLDTGQQFPSVSGIADPLSVVRGGLLGDKVYWWQSPDIKIDASPFCAPGPLFDGVEFDRDFKHENAVRAHLNRLYIQVTNRGAFDATKVNVKALYANISAGLPGLPADFWTKYPNNSTNTTQWHPIGTYKTIPVLQPARPVVLSWDWTPPLTAASHSCILVVIDSAADPIPSAHKGFNVASLVRNEKRVTQLNIHIITLKFPGPFPKQTLEILFHNDTDQEQLDDIIVDRSLFPRGNAIRLALDRIVTEGPLRESLEGLVLTKEAVPDKRAPAILEIRAERSAMIKRVRIPAQKSALAKIELEISPEARPGDILSFSILQRRGGEIVGGSTFRVHIQ